MPLDDREQRILEEIERQFYEDDPKLAETVRTASVSRLFRKSQQRAIIGFGIGLVIMLATFTSNTPIALVGFAIMVVAVSVFVMSVRRRTPRSRIGRDLPSGNPGEWLKRLRTKWRRGS